MREMEGEAMGIWTEEEIEELTPVLLGAVAVEFCELLEQRLVKWGEDPRNATWVLKHLLEVADHRKEEADGPGCEADDG